MAMTHDEMIEVIEAHRDGYEIQVRPVDSTYEWEKCIDPSWNFSVSEYRTKPREPRERFFLDHGGDRLYPIRTESVSKAYRDGYRVARFVEDMEFSMDPETKES
jgi:hypothetical protein